MEAPVHGRRVPGRLVRVGATERWSAGASVPGGGGERSRCAVATGAWGRGSNESMVARGRGRARARELEGWRAGGARKHRDTVF